MKISTILFVFFCSFFLSACGGSSSSSSDITTTTTGAPPDPGVTTNVAAASNGGVATASYDNGNAGIVNDGDNDISYYWAGNIQDDYVDVEFNKTYTIYKIIIYTSAMSTADATVQFAQASGGGAYTDISLLTDCYNLSMGSGKIDCRLNTPLVGTHIRFKITASSSVGTKKVYEIMAFGK